MKIDVHAHLDHELVEDLDKIIQNARDAGVKVIINNGLNSETNKITLEMAKKYDIVKPAFGIYPSDAAEISDFDLESEIKFIKNNNPIAIGECGLDGTYDNMDRQVEVFEKLVDLAIELDIPLIIHSRKAEIKILDIIEEKKPKKVVLHCFSGKKSLIKRGYDLGCYFSIPTNVVRAQNFQIMSELIPITRIFTETDTPYLSPIKETWNEPANVSSSIKKIAEIKKMDELEVETSIFMNYQKLFL